MTDGYEIEVELDPFGHGQFSTNHGVTEISGTYPISNKMRGWTLVEATVDETGTFLFIKLRLNDSNPRPCRGLNSNICVAEGCYNEACIKGTT